MSRKRARAMTSSLPAGDDWDDFFRRLDADSDESTFGADVSSSPSFAEIQQRLNAAGATPPLVVDGVKGPMSETAIRDFQTAHNLTVDGIVGPQTLAALGFAVAASQIWSVLPDKSTPMTADAVAKAIASGYHKVTGQSPTAQVLALMMAQSGFETGGWGQGIHNYNFGNKKAGHEDTYIQYFRCSEVVNGVETFYNPPSPVCRFAAYPSPTEAGEAFVRLLQSRPNWWNGLQTGTVAGFVSGLAASPAYFTADPSLYQAGVNRYLTQYSATAAKYATYVATGISLWLIAAGVTLGGYLAYERVTGKTLLPF